MRLLSTRLWKATGFLLFNLVEYSQGLAVSNQTTNSTSDCGHGWCSVKDSLVKQYVWVPTTRTSDYAPLMTASTISMTATVIVIVNTMLNSTSEITERPTPTTLINSMGTRTERITYTSNNQTLTTGLAFPTNFYIWPSAFTWIGSIVVTDSSSKCSVSTVSKSAIIPVPTGPQPTHFAWDLTWNQTLVNEDPRGKNFVLLRDWSDWQWKVASSYFPGQPAITTCYPRNPGPNWGGFTQTNWYTARVTKRVT